MSDFEVSLEKLSPVPAEAAQAYGQFEDQLVEQMNRAMAAEPDIQRLIGGVPLEVMYQNHRNHASFMQNIFFFNQTSLLAATIPWVYHSYHAHGFSYDYFRVALGHWLTFSAKVLEGQIGGEAILAIYQWMRDHHDEFIAQAETEEVTQGMKATELDSEGRRFLGALLAGDRRDAYQLSQHLTSNEKDLERFYLQTVQPSLYQVGALWEQGDISVAHEHMASAITSRIMSGLYARFMNDFPHRGQVLVTSAPNEFHEIGARMVADLLEIDGWDVDYLGANTPAAELIRMAQEKRPEWIALSVMMPFNLHTAADTIRQVREALGAETPKILVGGGVFSQLPDLWEALGADACADDARQAVQVLADSAP
ncbi:MAG: cobalamin-dependent protein [Desulfuromonadales bacterium]